MTTGMIRNDDLFDFIQDHGDEVTVAAIAEHFGDSIETMQRFLDGKGRDGCITTNDHPGPDQRWCNVYYPRAGYAVPVPDLSEPYC